MNLRVLFCLLVLCLAAACRPPAAPPRAIVILISIDGWRWDYLQRFEPPALTRLAAEGVRSEGLIPQFPSKTFPNHYTLVTGMRPARHGIVSNNMIAPDVPGDFAMSNREVLKDPRWWGGEPIWNTAERQGLLSAPLFWPGSEAAIQGRYATYWMPFDDDLADLDRVAQTLEWLQLPESKRPSFLTLYFSGVDTAGHRYGPDSTEVKEAALAVDRSIAALVQGVDRLGLAERVQYVIVSDHGMAAIAPERFIVLDDYLDPSTVKVVDWAPVVALTPIDGDVERVYAALAGKHPALTVYRNADLPAIYGLAGHARVPPVVGIADEGWYITSRAELARWDGGGDWRKPGGTHGYDARLQSMRGLFVASGSRLARARVVPPFENIHVYGLMCTLLGIEPAENDGDLSQVRSLLAAPR